MKVTLLQENHSMFDRYYSAEHGFSAWVEEQDLKILYDTGYSNKFIQNAEAMGIDLLQADYVILSHGHYDHSWGLKHLIQYYHQKAMARKPILLMAHEDGLRKRFHFELSKNQGLDVSREVLEQNFKLVISPEAFQLSPNLFFMGMTKTTNQFERDVPQKAKILRDGVWCDDFVNEDTQLCYRHRNGREVSIVAGCAHYGMCNIMEYAKALTGADHVHCYLGGSHLQSNEVSQERVARTCDYVRREQIEDFYICHDTDMNCLIQLANACPAKDVGVGLVVEWE